MRTVKVLMFSVLVVSVITLFSLSAHAAGENMTLWGKQTAGSGHAKNAKTEGNTLVLKAPATITAVEGDAYGYSIWTIVTPRSRTARSVLSGGKGKQNIIGKTLPAGSYKVIPGLYGKNSAYITIKLK